MTFLNHIEAITAKSARMLGFIKRILKEFQDYYALKTLFVSLVRPNLEYASVVWSPHQACHSERIERIQHNTDSPFECSDGLLILCLHMILGVLC
jgi:hypothetical protein